MGGAGEEAVVTVMFRVVLALVGVTEGEIWMGMTVRRGGEGLAGGGDGGVGAGDGGLAAVLRGGEGRVGLETGGTDSRGGEGRGGFGPDSWGGEGAGACVETGESREDVAGPISVIFTTEGLGVGTVFTMTMPEGLVPE